MKVINRCLDVAAVLILMTALAVMIAFVCGYRPYIVMSGSMEPDIPTGSVCIVDTNADYDDVVEGDVIAFRKGKGMVTHRVVSVTEVGIETKGDANERSDGITTTRENFHGKTLCAVPYMGYALHILQTPAAMWIAGILFAAWVLWKLAESEEGL